MVYTVVHKYAWIVPQSFRRATDAATHLAKQNNTNSFVIVVMDVNEGTGEVLSIFTSQVPRYASAENILRNIKVDCVR